MQIRNSFQSFLRYIWLYRWTFFIYIFLFVLIIEFFFIGFDYLRFLHTDIENARYLLSSLVQSEAAIIAIVITLSLVAIQLTAQSFSTRIIEVFKKTPDLWFLIGIYIFAMSYGLGVLKLLEEKSNLLEFHVSFAYFIGIYAFLALIPYIRKILNLLKPSTIIDLISEEISAHHILSSAGDKKTSIQSIFDIVQGSLMKYDYETLRHGLKIFENLLCEILMNRNLQQNETEIISKSFLIPLRRLGRLAAIRADEDSTIEIIGIFNEISGNILRFENLTIEIILALKNIGIVASSNKLEDAVYDAASILGEVGVETTKKKDEKISARIINSLEEIGLEATKQRLSFVTARVHYIPEEDSDVKSEIFEYIPKSGIVSEIAFLLRDIAIEALKHKPAVVALRVVDSLIGVGIEASRQKLEAHVYETAEVLEEIGGEAIDQKDIDVLTRVNVVLRVKSAFHEIGMEGVQQKLKDSVTQIIRGLGNIATVAAQARIDNNVRVHIVSKFVSSLEEIGIEAKKQKLKDSASKAITSLEQIEESVKEQKLNHELLSRIKNSIKKIDKVRE